MVEELNEGIVETEIEGIETVSGTSDYEELENKPKINGVELEGNKSLNDLGIDQDFVKDDNYTHTDNNYTTEEKTKLESLENYDDTSLKGKVSTNTSDIEDLKTNKADKSEIPDVSNFITKEVDNLTNYILKTSTGTTIELNIDNNTYEMTLNLKNADGTVISTDNIDLPLETMVISASYDNLSKEIVLTLKSGDTTRFSVADLVSGLQSEITSTNKLNSDLVDDSTSANKFVTNNEKDNWNNKQDALTFDSTPTQNSTNPVTSGGIYNALQNVGSDVYVYRGEDTAEDIAYFNNLIKNRRELIFGGKFNPSSLIYLLEDIVYYVSGIEIGYSEDDEMELILRFQAPSIDGYSYDYQELKYIEDSDTITKVERFSIDYIIPYSSNLTGYKKTLTTDNTKEFTPTFNYHPATKKYVDDLISSAGGSGLYIYKGENTTEDFTFFKNMRAHLLQDGEITPMIYWDGEMSFVYQPVNHNVYTDEETGDKILEVLCKQEYYDRDLVSGLPVFNQLYNIIIYNETKNTITIEWEDLDFDYMIPYTTNSTKTNWSQALPTKNRVAYTPTGDYNPATKKYVDDLIASAGGETGITYLEGTADEPINVDKLLDFDTLYLIKGNVTSNNSSMKNNVIRYGYSSNDKLTIIKNINVRPDTKTTWVQMGIITGTSLNALYPTIFKRKWTSAVTTDLAVTPTYMTFDPEYGDTASSWYNFNDYPNTIINSKGFKNMLSSLLVPMTGSNGAPTKTLSSLTTNDKTSIYDAINELVTRVSALEETTAEIE